jgi:hypothetical protein
LKEAWSPGVLPYRERKRKSTMRRVQLEEGFGLGFLPCGERRKIITLVCD